jgi:hypothetical protein
MSGGFEKVGDGTRCAAQHRHLMQEKEMPEWQKSFPRLYELYCASEMSHPDNYFRDFGKELRSLTAIIHYERIEKDLNRLSLKPWQQLLEKARPFVTVRDRESDRHWSALFDILNERRGYLFLDDEGYSEIEFLDPSDIGAPDLFGRGSKGSALVEVKTINKSNEDFQHMLREEVQKEKPELSDFLRCKIHSKISDAAKQLRNCSIKVERMICYLVIREGYELWLGNRANEKIQALGKETIRDGIEIVFETIV